MQELYKLKLVLVIGNLCSGKSTFLKYANNLNYITLDWSSIFKSSSSSLKRDTLLNNIIDDINEKGRLFFLNKLVTIVNNKYNEYPTTNGIVIAGARNASELSYLLGRFEFSKVAYIHSDLSVRLKRYLKRNRENDPKDFFSFVRSDIKELQNGLAECIFDYANDIIDNNGKKEKYLAQIKTYLESI